MEIFKELNSQESKEFENLLNSQLSKTKIEENTVIDGTVTKITNKYVFLFIPNAKSEAMVDKNELKTLNIIDKVKEGSKIPVLIESLENKEGEVIVSATKAQKIKGWNQLERAYEKNEPIIGKIVSKCKGGVIAEHIDSGSLLFMPGSQISEKPLKDIGHLMNEPMKLAIIKLDKIRGNCCVSRRQIVSSNKKEDRAKIIAKYNVNDILENCVCKSITSFGAFFEINGGEIDSLTHLQELSYSRINSADEILEVGKKYRLKIIAIDAEKMQISTSIKALSPDPFDNMAEFVVGKDYIGIVKKILDYGFFIELKSGLSALCHQSEISYLKKNINPKTFAKVNDKIKVRITDIDLEKRRIAVSHKLTTENPWEKFKKEVSIGSIISGEIIGTNDYALFVKVDKYLIESFLHSNDLHFLNNPEEEIKKYKKGDKFEKLKVLEVDAENQKIRVSLREAISEDPFKFYDNYNEGDVLTCKVVSIENKGLSVKPEGSEIETFIKKSQLAISPSDQRPGRWTQGDRVDCLLEKKNKKSISLSIRALDEKLNADALEKYGDSGSGKSLPFASLSDKIDKKKKSE